MQFACVSAAPSEWETGTVVVVLTSSSSSSPVYLIRIMQYRTDRERRRRLCCCCCTPPLCPFWTGAESASSRRHGHVKPLFGTNPLGHLESDEGNRFTRKKNRERPVSHTFTRTVKPHTHTHTHTARIPNVSPPWLREFVCRDKEYHYSINQSINWQRTYVFSSACASLRCPP